MPYAEAIAQWLGVRRPFLFESGSGMYDPASNCVVWSPEITAEATRALAELREKIKRDLLPRYPGALYEFAKQTDVGVVHPDADVIAAMLDEVRAMFAAYSDSGLDLHYTDVSVNIIPRGANKGAGLRWLAERVGVALDEVAYIGDSGGDIPALQCAGVAFAPANAVAEVRAISEVTQGAATDGVLEAYRTMIARNRDESSSSGSPPSPPSSASL